MYNEPSRRRTGQRQAPNLRSSQHRARYQVGTGENVSREWLLCTGCMSSGKSLPPSGPHFSYVSQKGDGAGGL